MADGSPRFRTTLVGRDALLAEVCGRLADRGRIVTLTGPGGVGKTRLALAVADRMSPSSGACHVVRLGPVRRVDRLVPAVADAFGAAADDVASVAAAVNGGLVVLDELEHLPGAGAVIAALASAAPTARWLATSRCALGLPDEQEICVPPLPLQSDLGGQGGPALQLFLEAAGRAPSTEELASIDAVLRLTAGLPLAIELAAGRLAVLGMAEVLERLETRYFPTLRDPLDPERALDGILEATCAAIPPTALQILAECTVFATPFTVADVEQVASDPDATLDALHALHRWHLVKATGTRISMLEPVRRFARRHLSDEGLAAARHRHADWVVARAEPLLDAHRREPDRLDALEGLAPELAAALDRAAAGQVGAAAGILAGRALCVSLEQRGHTEQLLACAATVGALDPGQRDDLWLAWVDAGTRRVRRMGGDQHPDALPEAEALLAAAEGRSDPRPRLHALLAAAAVHQTFGDTARAAVMLEQCLEIARQSAPELEGAVLGEQILVLHDAGDHEAAETCALRCLELARADNDRIQIAHALAMLATMALEREAFAEADDWNQQSEAAWAVVGNRRKHALAVLRGGIIAEHRGELQVAEARYLDAEAALHELRSRPLVAWARGGRGRLALQRGDFEAAAALLPAWADAGPSVAHYVPLYGAALAAIRGDAEGVRRLHDTFDGPPRCRALVALAVVVAEGMAAPAGSGLAESRAIRARALWDEAPPPPVVGPGFEVLVDALERHASSWSIARDGAWFRPAAQPRIDVGGPAARLLAALATHHGGDPLDVAALCDAGWPGERIVPRAAANRVYVTLSKLRKLGLGEILLREEGGWRLDPRIAVRIEGAPA